MDFSHRQTVRPTTQPVTIDEARDYLEQPGNDADTKIFRAIDSAAAMFERHTRRALMLQTWTLETSCKTTAIELPRPPLVSIVSCQSRQETTDDWADVLASDYVLEADRSPARMTWTEPQPPYLKIVYQCGYADRSELPSDYITSVLQLVTFLFENRGDVEAKLPISLKAMLDEQRAGTVQHYFSV